MEIPFTSAPSSMANNFDPMICENSGLTRNGKQRWYQRRCDRSDLDGSEIINQLLLGSMLVFEHVRSTSGIQFCDAVSVWRCEAEGSARYTPETPRFCINTKAGASSVRGGAAAAAAQIVISALQKDELISLIAACALREEMSPHEFAQELPDDFAKMLIDHKLV